jgi:putative ATP-dependent endonuclease of OLD family
MKLAKISFTNFRCFRSEDLCFDRYASLVGPNNCGKSTVLRALNLFYGSDKVNAGDFYVGADPDDQLSIKYEFSEVFGEAAEELSHYVRNGALIFEIVATRNNGTVTSKCRGIRYGLKDFAEFFAKRTANERHPIYDQLRIAYPGLAAWQNMTQAEAQVRAVELEHIADHVQLPSEDNAYGVAGPVPTLKKYLDWIFVPAVKDASSEASEQRNSAFTKLILYAVRARCDFSERLTEIRTDTAQALKEILSGADNILKEVGGDIDREFKNLTTTPIDVSLDWGEVDEIVIKEPSIRSLFKDGRVLGGPENFGHGLQRTYLMALLSLAARTQTKDGTFNLLLGIEEPELYQHPPQARFLASALYELSETNCQVIITTHSPHFTSGRTFESIRVLRKRENVTRVFSWTIDEQRSYCAMRKGQPEIGAAAALSGIDRSLQTNVAELFFASKVILVEGAEDTAIIEAYLKNIDKLNDFLRAGCHIVPVGGKTKMPMLIAMARGFSIDVMCIFDFDMDKPWNERQNTEITRYAADLNIVIPEELTSDFRTSYFFGSHMNIQKSIIACCPEWQDTKQIVASEWG